MVMSACLPNGRSGIIRARGSKTESGGRGQRRGQGTGGRSELGLPDDAADEKGTETVEVKRGLLRLAHRLDNGRERKQILADESDDEVVVVAIEAVAREADVVG